MQEGLGLWLGVSDPRNHHYAMKLAQPKSVMWPAPAPITDQGEVGACSGFTCLDVVNTTRFWGARWAVKHSRAYLPNDAGFDFYHDNTVVDGWPGTWRPNDTGSSMLAAGKTLKKAGYIRAYSWAYTMDSLLHALSLGPVLMGTLWTSGMSDPDSSGLIRPTGTLDGGHAYMLRGANYAKRRVRMRNHWRRDWGINGEAEIGFDDLAWLLDAKQQGECVVPAPI